MDTLIHLAMINSVRDLINRNIKLFRLFDSIYLFGSILENDTIPNDIDILLLYSKYDDAVLEDFYVICSAIESSNGFPIDFTVLSVEEEMETAFLERLNSKYLRLI